MDSDFIEKEKLRVKKLFAKKHQLGFESRTDLADWFAKRIQLQKYKCEYCETSIFDIRKLIEKEMLKTRKTAYGKRGLVLEIDKKINEIGYTKDNCVLACYYCNNDKSYIFDHNEYKKCFGENRKKFFTNLLKHDGTN
ncbi:hypothetical protein [Sulfuricurvum sp.]|uniref:hypothetical protein n=1 Tax=Sulfuricurvum sp. TaxID=2025608 RepID=UPI00262A7E11|nr:hypothetical protein [Sulfuricurvum sp.]MDD4950571.1 hypothetical protein [Sulfuricurvum sp.]